MNTLPLQPEPTGIDPVPFEVAPSVQSPYGMPAPLAYAAATNVMPLTIDYRVLPANPVEEKADRFSKTSSALVVLGLLLVGGAIGPLLTYFQVQAMATYWIGLAYIVLATLVVMWLAGKMFAHSARRDMFMRTTRVAVLAAAEIAVLLLSGSCSEFFYHAEATALVLAGVLLLLHLVPNRERRWNAYGLLRANEIAVMFVLCGLMLFRQYPRAGEWWLSESASTLSMVLYTVALAVGIVVVVLRVRELWTNGSWGSAFAVVRHAAVSDGASHDTPHPLAANAGFVILTVLGATSLVASYVYGCTPLYANSYAYDVVFMAGAFLSVVLGFAANKSSLRNTGLALALCTVAKMVLLDTLSYDLLSKAIAYAIGGAVCFAIGAMYNYAVKRLVQDAAEPSAAEC